MGAAARGVLLLSIKKNFVGLYAIFFQNCLIWLIRFAFVSGNSWILLSDRADSAFSATKSFSSDQNQVL